MTVPVSGTSARSTYASRNRITTAGTGISWGPPALHTDTPQSSAPFQGLHVRGRQSFASHPGVTEQKQDLQVTEAPAAFDHPRIAWRGSVVSVRSGGGKGKVDRDRRGAMLSVPAAASSRSAAIALMASASYDGVS